MKKFIVLLMALVMSVSTCALFGCSGGSGTKEGVLDITFYKGGYGTQWLEDACEAYKKIRPDFEYNLIPESAQDCNAASALKAGSNLSDIYMANDNGFNEFVSSGYIEPLKDVYESKVTTSAGEKTVYDFLLPAVRDKYWRQKKAGQGDNVPWAVPMSILPGAMVYNVDVLESTTHVESGFTVGADKIESGKWVAPPETIDELMAYFYDINEYNKTASSKIIPLGWPGQSPNILFFVLYQWWAESQGVNTSNHSGQGSWYDFWNYGNTATSVSDQQTLSLSVFDQQGQKDAIDTLRSLIFDSEGNYINSLSNVNSTSINSLGQTFVRGSTKIAISLASSFLEKENEAWKNDLTPNYKFMNVPSLNSYTGNQLCYASVGEVMYIPAKANDKQLAKDFLTFLSQESQVVDFAKKTGSLRPFDCNPMEIDSSYAWTDFNKSVFEVYNNSEMLIEYPKNTEKDLISDVYKYSKPHMFGNVSLENLLSLLKSKNGTELMAHVKNESKKQFDGFKTSFDMKLVD